MARLPQDIAIRVADVHKVFKVPHHSDDSIKHRIITAFEPKDKAVDIHEALRGITFDVKKGEFFGIVGRNGSGKSTLLKIISNIYTPTSGYTQHSGKLVAFIELGVGFNPQLSGRDNVYLNAAMLGFSRKEIDAMYDEIVAFAELEDFMELKLKNYSSGMKVRLAFSVAIRAQADILILDEVLAVGDAAFKKKCYDYFKNLKEAHKTIVLVSHSMGLIREYCDRAILIEDGKIAYEGDSESVADKYTELFSPNNYTNTTGVDAAVDLVECYAKNSNGKIQIKVSFKPKQNIEGAVLVSKITRGNRTLAGASSKDLGLLSGINLTKDEVELIQISLDNSISVGDFSLGFVLESQDGKVQHGNWAKVMRVDNQKETESFPVKMTGTIEVVE